MVETFSTAAALKLSSDLLHWYGENHRDLPWRVPPDRGRAGERADPYRVWLSEIMLQQTTVAAVVPYFLRFIARWPDVSALAAAPLDDVLAAWAGLGYYARARNLHRCAIHVTEQLGGRFPDTETALVGLPGIGPYTAAAIAAIAFGRPAVVVDGNVERVMARLHGETEPLPGAKARLREHAARLTPTEESGDHAQAVMDLGATVCTPRAPRCDVCPWRMACAARRKGVAESLPHRQPRRPKPVRHGIAYIAADNSGAVLSVRRPPSGLLGGMLALPSTGWAEGQPEDAPPVAADWIELGEVRHTFTHFHLVLRVQLARLRHLGSGAMPLGELEKAAPTVFVKACRLARPHVVDGCRQQN